MIGATMMELGQILIERRVVRGESKLYAVKCWPEYTLISPEVFDDPPAGMARIRKGCAEFQVTNGYARYVLADFQVSRSCMTYMRSQHSFTEPPPPEIDAEQLNHPF